MKLTARQLRQIIREEIQRHKRYTNVFQEADYLANETAPQKFSFEVSCWDKDPWEDKVISLAPGQRALIEVLGNGYATLEIWIQQFESVKLVDRLDNLKRGVKGVRRAGLPSGVELADGDILVADAHKGQIAGIFTGNFALENTGEVEAEFVVGARCLGN